MATANIAFTDLKVLQLNAILKYHGLPTVGNKSVKVTKLVEAIGKEGISEDELQEIMAEVEQPEIKEVLTQMAKAIAELTKTVQTLPAAQRPADNLDGQDAISTSGSTRNTPSMFSTAHTETPQVQMTSDDQNPRDAQQQQQFRPTNRREYTVREVAEVLPEFDPLRRNISAYQFMVKTRQLQRAYNWSEDISIIAVMQCMKGVAKDWIDAQPVFTNLYDFETVFLRDFPCVKNSADTHKELAKQKRSPNESYVQFYYKVLAMGRRGDVEEQAIATYIIDGLNDGYLTRTLLAMNINSCNELLASLGRLSGKYNHSDMVQMKQEGGKKESPGPRCFNCNEMGHYAAKCPKPSRKIKCDNCGKMGHETRVCRKDKRTPTVAKIEGNEAYPPVTEKININGIDITKSFHRYRQRHITYSKTHRKHNREDTNL